MTAFSTKERAALDRVTVPAMRVGLAGDIVAAASNKAAPARRGTRGSWRRHGRVLLGAGALVIATAAAAATGLLDRLPIHIPGITRVAAAEPVKPKHVVHAPRHHEAVGIVQPVALASLPVADPTPLPPAPQEQWRERRAARIAAGLPVQRPLLQRAMAAKLRGLTPAERRAAMVEWRRIKALPPEERKLAVARVKADFLAQHPKMAARYEQRLEAKSAAAAAGPGDPRAVQPVPPVAPMAGPRAEGRQRLENGERPDGDMLAPAGGALRPDGTPRPQLTPEQRAQRQALRQWRAERRAQRMGNGPRPFPRRFREGFPHPKR